MEDIKKAIVITGLCLFALAALAAVPASIAADGAGTHSIQEDNETCEGTPQMSRTSITSPEDSITSEQPGVVEANFRVDPTVPEDCTVIVDLEFSFNQNGFQFGGGSEWQQSTTDLVATQFEVKPGEIRDIRAELHTNGAEPGDEVTVTADYELWYEGDRENSRQQSGIRHTIGVEEPNELDEDDGGNETDDENGTDREDETDDENETDGGDDEDDETGLLERLEENIAVLLASGVILMGVVAVVGLIKREPILNVITGGK